MAALRFSPPTGSGSGETPPPRQASVWVPQSAPNQVRLRRPQARPQAEAWAVTEGPLPKVWLGPSSVLPRDGEAPKRQQVGSKAEGKEKENLTRVFQGRSGFV